MSDLLGRVVQFRPVERTRKPWGLCRQWRQGTVRAVDRLGLMRVVCDDGQAFTVDPDDADVVIYSGDGAGDSSPSTGGLASPW